MARVPTEGVPPVAPVDLVPNRVCVNDDADTASTMGPRQHRIADHWGPRIASDNHGRARPLRRRISTEKRLPSLSTTSQEKGPRHCVLPSAWTVRRASSSDGMFASRRPSLVIRVHIATALGRSCRYVHLVEPNAALVRRGSQGVAPCGNCWSARRSDAVCRGPSATTDRHDGASLAGDWVSQDICVTG